MLVQKMLYIHYIYNVCIYIMYTHTTYSAEEFTVHPTSYRKKKKQLPRMGPPRARVALPTPVALAAIHTSRQSYTR